MVRVGDNVLLRCRLARAMYIWESSQVADQKTGQTQISTLHLKAQEQHRSYELKEQRELDKMKSTEAWLYHDEEFQPQAMLKINAI